MSSFASVLEDGSVGTDQTSWTTTGTLTPVASRLLLAVVHCFGGTVGITTDGTLSGGGVTWVLMARIGNADARRSHLFRAMGAGSSGALTFTRGGSDNFDSITIQVTEVQSVDTSGSNGAGAIAQLVTNTVQVVNPSIAITPTAPENALCGMFGIMEGNLRCTFGDGYTELADFGVANIGSYTEYRTSTDTNIDMTIDGGSGLNHVNIFGVEVQEPASVTSITDVSPASGSTAGGTPVTITGTGFLAGDGIRFGANDATSVVIVNSTTITCVTPAGSAGAVDVHLRRGGSNIATDAGAFTYVDPALTSFEVTEESGAALGNFTVGTARNVRVRALDQFGGVFTGFTSTVDVSATGGGLTTGSGTSPAFVSGARVIACAFTTLATGVELDVEDTSTGLITGSSAAFDVVAGGGGTGGSLLGDSSLIF